MSHLPAFSHGDGLVLSFDELVDCLLVELAGSKALVEKLNAHLTLTLQVSHFYLIIAHFLLHQRLATDLETRLQLDLLHDWTASAASIFQHGRHFLLLFNGR